MKCSKSPWDMSQSSQVDTNYHFRFKVILLNKLPITEIIRLQVHPEYTQSAFTFYSHQWKQQNHIRNMFEVNNNNTKMTSITLFWCLYCKLSANFTHCSKVSIINFRQVYAAWVTFLIISQIRWFEKHHYIY